MSGTNSTTELHPQPSFYFQTRSPQVAQTDFELSYVVQVSLEFPSFCLTLLDSWDYKAVPLGLINILNKKHFVLGDMKLTEDPSDNAFLASC